MPIIDLLARKKFEDFLVELIERVNKFPKSQKFGLGDKLLKTAFSVMDEIIVIQLSDKSRRQALISPFNYHLEQLRQYLKIAWRKEYISHRNFMALDLKTDEVGRMVWSLCRKSEN